MLHQNGKPAARKTVIDLLLNAVAFYRFLITYHNSYVNASPTHVFFFVRNKFHRSLIFHYFIRFNNVGKGRTRNGMCVAYIVHVSHAREEMCVWQMLIKI